MYEVDFIDLAKMARQYLGRPASSAGVERLFSKAGKLYGDDKKAQDYTSLEHALYLPVLKLSEVCVELRIVRRHAGQGGEFSLVLVCGR